jgi:hypothetical protein
MQDRPPDHCFELMLPWNYLDGAELADGLAWGFQPNSSGISRDACNPEVGWVGAVLYLLAFVMLASRPAKGLPVARFAPPHWLRLPTTAQGTLLLLLFLGQSGRSYLLIRSEWPQLVEHGGHVDCNCKKWDDTVHL